MQTNSLPLAPAPKLGRGTATTPVSPAAAPVHANTVRDLNGNEDTAVGVVVDTCTCVAEQGVRRLGAARGDDQIAVDGLAVDRHATDVSLPGVRRDRAGHPLAQVDRGRHSDAGLTEGFGGAGTAVVACDHHGSLAGLHRPESALGGSPPPAA